MLLIITRYCLFTNLFIYYLHSKYLYIYTLYKDIWHTHTKTYIFIYTHVYVQLFQFLKDLLSEQCKEIDKNNRMGKASDHFKKLDTKGIFHTKIGTIKDRNVNINNSYNHNDSYYCLCIRCMLSTTSTICDCDPHNHT